MAKPEPAPKDVPEAEEDYVSSEDEDFNPTTLDAADEDDAVSSSSDSEAPEDTSKARKKTNTKKRKLPDALPEDDLDSGDEATIRESRRKKRRSGKHGTNGDDSGGEGGLVKTRAQRRAEKQERQEFRRTEQGHVTIDVDDLWAKLSSKPIGRRTANNDVANAGGETQDDIPAPRVDGEAPVEQAQAQAQEDDTILIKRTYDFAGQTVTEEKRVHKSSAEAKLYLASLDASKAKKRGDESKSASPDVAETGPLLRRPLRRASKFEPNPTGEVKGLPAHKQRLRTPSRADVLAQQKRLEEQAERKKKAQKLTTVQKSAIDWAAHVDEEGLKDELDEYGRSREGFIARMEFMRGVRGKAEEERRTARLGVSSAAAGGA